MKKLLAAVITLSMVLSFAAIPAHAASFSSANIVYTDVGGLQNKWDSNFSVQESTTYSTNRYNYVYLKRANGSALGSEKKFVRLNSDFGPGGGDYDGTVNYAHSRFYMAQNINSADERANIFIKLNYDTGSNDGRIENVLQIDSAKGDAYATGGASAGTNLSRWIDVQGAGPWTVRINSGDWIYHQIDLIVDVDGAQSGMVYIFLDRHLIGFRKATKLDNSNQKIYHGYTVAARTSQWSKTNDQVKIKLGDDNVRATCYANTDDYKVTLEDVINHQGLSDDISGISNAIMKTSDLEAYMPGDANPAYDGSDTYNLINGNVTYNAAKTVATIAQNTDDAAQAALMVRGAYPIGSSNGIGYSSYANTGRYVKFSFDQEIVKAQNVYYGVGNNSYNNCINMWDNGGNLVVHLNGESEFGYSNPTLDGKKGRPDVSYNGTAHLDWVLDNVDKMQYLLVDGTLVSYGRISTARNNQVFIYTKGDAELNISDWSMTVYNQDATLADIGVVLPAAVEEIDTETVLDEAVDKAGETVVLTENGILDIGEDLYFRNGYVDATNGYIRTGDRNITGSKVRFTSEGKISVDDGYSAKISRDNGDGTKDQGFMFGLNNPTGIRTVILDVTGGENDGKTVEKEFDFDGWEIYGLVNFGFEIDNIPTAVDFNVKSF